MKKKVANAISRKLKNLPTKERVKAKIVVLYSTKGKRKE